MHATIFDMDGLLIDSEPLWRAAEVEVFGALGVPLTEEMCAQTTGLRLDDVVRYWRKRYRWSGADDATVCDRIVEGVLALARERGQPLPGVRHAVELARTLGPVGLATSSPTRLIEPLLSVLGLESAFDVTVSAERETHGKPHPAVYLTTAEALGAAPTDCTALEDSLNGLVAATATRMRCVAVPQGPDRADPRFALAAVRLESLAQLTAAHLRGG